MTITTTITHDEIEAIAQALEGLAKRLREMEPDRAVAELDALCVYLERLGKAQKDEALAGRNKQTSLGNIAELADARTPIEKHMEKRKARA